MTLRGNPKTAARNHVFPSVFDTLVNRAIALCWLKTRPSNKAVNTLAGQKYTGMQHIV